MKRQPDDRRRALFSLLILAVLVTVVFPLADPASAATYRTWIAQVPAAPTSVDTVRVWMDSDTALGETAGVEYNVGASYIKVLGTYDNTTYPGANWYADIPAQSGGTFVQYQLFTRNQFGSDYGFTGFNWNYTVTAVLAPITPVAAKAMWLDRDTIAWNGVAGSSYKLLYDPDGGLTTAAEATACSFSPNPPADPCFVPLSTSGAISGFPKNPNATGKTRLVTSLSADAAKHLLRGEVVVASYNGIGGRLDVTRAQIQSVLDDLYVDNGPAENATLGVTYSGGAPTVRVWAPTAKSVTLKRYATSAGAEVSSHTMTLDPASGVWSVTGTTEWDRQFYLFDVEVYVPSTDAVEHNLVTDPYSVSLSQDGAATGDVRSQFVNLDDGDLEPTGWDTFTKPALAAPEDIVVYEVHVRDFSINDASVTTATDRGTYKAFTYDGTGPHTNTTLSNGMNHLRQLQQAGLTHIHLLPAFDIASVIEPVGERIEPVVPVAGRDSFLQQQAVDLRRATDSFNWGYDPYHYGVPEGSYATNPDGAPRIREFREMVQALNQNGLRVVMDVVYNHTAASGQDDHSVLDKVTPGYYYRYDADGNLYNSSCCSDTAAEYAMMEKLMIDTVVRFAVDYKVDGFRFDLMNLHTRQNMLNLKAVVQAVDPNIYLYGEGWDFGSALDKDLTSCPNCYARKHNMTGAGIGLFNDIIRDAAHGGYSQDTIAIRQQGFINGLSYDWNGYEYANRYQSDLWVATDQLRSALRGSGTDWNGQGSPFTDDPQEAVNYVEKHDNETLFDQNVFKLPNGSGSGNPGWIGSGIPVTSMADRVRSQNMGTSIVGLAQGIPFIQMGSDILRSKSLDRNSYDSGDWFNRVWWDRSRNNFGSGLPPAWDNSTRWGIMSPLLTNTALDPTTADMDFSAAHLREILRIRKSSALFRLTSEAEVNARTSHYNSGNVQDGLIVLRLQDEAGTLTGSVYKNILVFFNANKMAQSITISGADAFALHPVHTDGVDDDPVITGGAVFNDATDQFTIPARTTAVFVSNQPIANPSTLDWVGLMSPRGGVAHQIAQSAAGGNFDVFVQVYEAGVTPGVGQGAGIACYLHWGKYGEAWTDLAMVYNIDIGNNDEYKASIPQATLNSLTPGTVGFTAFCKKTAESGVRWKQDSYGVSGGDDQGDGLITVVPTLDSSLAPAGAVFVHLFEWPWADIEKECTFLAAKGYTAVQVSPPNEHLVPTANQGGGAGNQYPWWVRYQPVTHDTAKFTSRSGTWSEFVSMVNACNTLGVGIYVDAVINHMADIEVGTPPRGTALTEYNASPASARFYGAQYGADDFHSDCAINSYADRRQVQRCQLSGLPDLDTSKTDVQNEIRSYLQALIDAGVKGFRIDGAKHMAAQDIAAILNGLTSSFYVFQEVIDLDPSERVRDWEYTPSGDVTEFAWSQAMGDKFNGCSGSLADLATLPYGNMMPTRFAQTFVDNHDNQRGHGPGGSCVVDHRDGRVHLLANIFTLAYPYGHPSVMSSYYWTTDPNSNTGDSLGPPSTNDGGTTWGVGLGAATRPVYGPGQVAGDTPANCAGAYPAAVTSGDLGKWVCEHRNTAIANMVKFRQVTAGQAINNWQAFSSNHIAFGLGNQGFVAINRTGSNAVTTYQTDLRAGEYCDIVHYDYDPLTNECMLPGTATRAPEVDLIVVDEDGQIVNQALGSMDAFAIHRGAGPLAVTLASFEAAQQGDAVLVSWETATEIDNRGFNLYRGLSPAGPDRQLNQFVIPSQGQGSPGGFEYSWLDQADLTAGTTYYYWLEDLDVYGATTLHGPVSATFVGPTAVTLDSVQASPAVGAPALPWLWIAAATGAALGLSRLRRRG